MKKIFFSLLVLSGFAANAQDLAIKIPKDAMAVASVRGEHFLELMSVAEFDRSAFGRKMIAEMADHKEKGDFKSIEDFGIKLSGTMYYYNQQTDSIGYNCLLVPLSNAAKFEALLDQSQTSEIKRKGDTRTFYDGDNAFFQWNNDFVYIVYGSLHKSFIEKDSAMSARYGIKEVSSYDYNNDYDNDPVAEEASEAEVDTAVAYSIDTYEGVSDSAVAIEDVRQPQVSMDEGDTYPTVKAEPDEETAEDVTVAYPMVAEATLQDASDAYNYYDSPYQKALKEQREIKEALTQKWIESFAQKGFNDNTTGSILNNQNYTKTLDKDAAASFYLSSVSNAFDGLFSYYMYPRSWRNAGSYMSGYGSVNANLFLHEKEMRITTDMEVDDAKAASYKKIYSHKLNKKFANYINTDKVIGMLSSSMNTEAYLNEMPQLLNSTYGKILGMYGEEIGIGAELFSLLLDEKAVAKVIKGDALLLLTDVGPRETTYTSYEYDEESYERKPVTKKRTETLPDFLFMMSSDDTHFIQRLLNYGISKEQMELKNGIYSITGKLSRKSPFGLHILIKDGIIFCGTSLKDLELISLDKFQANITKEQKKLLLSQNFTMYFNPHNLIGKIPAKEFGHGSKLKEFNEFLGMTGDMYARSLGVKNNRISAEMVAEVPAGNVNSLKYFFSLVEKAAKLDGHNADDDIEVE